MVREAQRVIAEHAKRPFLLGYRISPEESGDGELRIGDAYALIDRLIESGVDYIHASLFDIPNAKPVDCTGEHTTAELIVERVGDRVPLIVNPKRVELAGAGREAEITTMLDSERVPLLAIPDRLWNAIRSAKGWFTLAGEAEAV